MRDGHRTWLLPALGPEFTLLVLAPSAPAWAEGLPVSLLCVAPQGSRTRADAVVDVDGLVAARYDLQPGTAYLLRPDQHVCERWRAPDAAGVRAALARATGMR